MIITHDGEKIDGNTSLEIIENLKAGSRFCSDQTTEEFMKGLAERWFEYSGKEVRTDSVNFFIADLFRTNFLKNTD